MARIKLPIKLLIPFIFIGINLEFAQVAKGKECDLSTCISVTADDENHLVIKVIKGKPGSKATSKPTSVPTASKKPAPSKTSIPVTLKKPWIPWLPKPTFAPSKTPTPKVTRTRKPRSTKPRVTTISGSEISEQVKKMLPNGLIITQPSSGALVREPVNFMTTIPNHFDTVIVVLDVPIQIHLKASYTWEFGDGEMRRAESPGAPYPVALITHSYKDSRKYKVNLSVNWSGTWSSGALSAPISGSIHQKFDRELEIFPADTRLTR